jgi:SAM-dependent methyltransferase
MTDSLLRKAEHGAFRKISLSGKVVDLGGDTRSAYQSLIQGDIQWVTVNLNPYAGPDILHDLEKPLPFPDASFDGAVLANVIEHIYDYKQLLREAARILRSSGTAVIVVPFMFPNHPSPGDYRRFTAMALERECREAGFADVRVEALGTGVLSACHLFLNRLLPGPLRALHSRIDGPVTKFFDRLLSRLARAVGKSYRPEDYALGFSVVAVK